MNMQINQQIRDKHKGAVHQEDAPERQRFSVEVPVDQFVEESPDAGDALEGEEDDLEILFHTLVLNVFHVQLDLVGHHLLDIDTVRILGIAQNLVLVDIFYRSIVGNSRLDTQHLPLFLGVHLHIFPHFRTRPHKTHVTFKHIKELG